MNLSHIAIWNIKGSDYCCIITRISKSKVIRPSLLDSFFNVTEILKIVLWDVGIDHYPLFSRKNNTCLCPLLKINCDAGSIHLCLDTDEMFLLSMQLLLNHVNRHTLQFKVTSENKFYTLLKKLFETNTLTYHFDKIFLVHGVR